MGILSKKPMVWVFGQLLHYHLRLRSDIQLEVNNIMNIVFNDKSVIIQHHHRNKFSRDIGKTIGIHIRYGGSALDGQRQSLNITDFLPFIDQKVKEIELKGFYVSMVYICSNELELAGVFSSEFMMEMYPRTYRYSVLKHISFNGLEPELVLLAQNNDKTTENIPSRRDIFIEYINDIEILTKCDYFIGSHSNIYAIVGGLRLARHPHRPLSSTCFIESRWTPHYLVCEGSTESQRFWRDSYQFIGGSLYWIE